jgi:hypothetical protein
LDLHRKEPIQATHYGRDKAFTGRLTQIRNDTNTILPLFPAINIDITNVTTANFTDISSGTVLTTNVPIARKPVDEPPKNVKPIQSEWMAPTSTYDKWSSPLCPSENQNPRPRRMYAPTCTLLKYSKEELHD